MTKTLVYVLGIVILLVGVLGFFNDPVLGLFEVNAVHNIIHIVTGLALLGLGAAGGSTMTLGLKVLGVVYALVTVLGFVLQPNDGLLLGLIEVNMMDHVLHLVLAVVFLALGFAGRASDTGPMSTPPPAQPAV